MEHGVPPNIVVAKVPRTDVSVDQGAISERDLALQFNPTDINQFTTAYRSKGEKEQADLFGGTQTGFPIPVKAAEGKARGHRKPIVMKNSIAESEKKLT